MADELSSLPVQSPLRITVRPYQGEMGEANPYDFSSYLNSLPVEDPNQFQQIAPSGVGITRLPVKVEDAIRQAATENWVSRMIKSGVTLPKDVYEGKVDPLSEEGIERTQDLAGLNAAGPLAMKPGTATLGSGMTRMANKTQDAFHGTPKAGFEKFDDPRESFILDRMLGTHVSKDPEIANTFATNQGSKNFGQEVQGGGVYPLKIPHDKKFLEVNQELHPYITDRNTPKTSSNVNSDQNAIEMLVMKTVYQKHPEMLAHYLTEARAVKENALGLANDMAAGKTVELPVDGKMNLDKFIKNFGGKPYNDFDRVEAAHLFKEEMQKKGYAGIKYINTSPMETAGAKDPTSYIVFDPHTHIRSKYTNMLMAEGGKVGAPLSALEKAPPFYSAVENAVKNAKQNSATADQWLGFLKNQPGVKPEELQYTLKDLPKGQISKADLERHIAENKVELKEVKLGGNDRGDPKSALAAFSQPFDWFRPVVMEIKSLEDVALARKANANFKETFKEWSDEDLWKDIQKYKELPYEEFAGKTKYHSYQLPDGENYKETLLTLPERKLSNEEAGKRLYEMFARRGGGQTWEQLAPENRQHYINEASQGNYNTDVANSYRSSHWDEPNVLAHIRHNDRFIPDPNGPSINDKLTSNNPDGWHITQPEHTVKNKWMVKSNDYNSKGMFFDTKAEAEAALAQKIGGPAVGDKGLKTLHIEEIQSDWHQAGRKQGYKATEAEKEAMQKELERLRSERAKAVGSNDPEERIKYTKLAEQEAALIDQFNKRVYDAVPDAPFKKTWDELALKRMIRQAAEQGYDAISWTPGEAQAARYDLSKHVDKVNLVPDPSGKFRVDAFKDNKKVIEHYGKDENEVAATVGKEVAEKLFKNRNQHGAATVSGLDLKVGGEGMKAFYDKMLVDRANSLVKKYGTKVEYTRIAVPHKAGQGQVYENVPTIRITPELRKQALEKGFPLFSSGLPTLTPVDHDPFKPKLVPINYNPFENPNAT